MRPKRWMLLTLALAGPALVGCSDSAQSATPNTVPAELVEVDGTKVPQVKLSEKAVQRLGIEMSAVSLESGTKIIPYASVVYEPNGDAWAYISPEARTYQRSRIEIAGISGQRVLLSAGLDGNPDVVTVGTAELFGVEQGIGD